MNHQSFCQLDETFFMQKKKLKSPCFFASISTVKTNYSIEEYFSFLNMIGYPNILISAYDMYYLQLHDSDNKIIIEDPLNRKNYIMMDSGGYEAYWLRNNKWDISKFNEILSTNNPDYFLSYDYRLSDDQNGLYQKHWKEKNIIPIIHNERGDFWDSILSKQLNDSNKLIAIPERELGSNIIDRVLSLRHIFKQIEEDELSYRLHLLGTGNPLSLLLYCACGVKSFDGLEWCKTVVNPISKQLLHFTQRAFFHCECQACKSNNNQSYETQTLAHNILFYLDWMNEIQHFLYRGKIIELLEEHFEKTLLSEMGMV